MAANAGALAHLLIIISVLVHHPSLAAWCVGTLQSDGTFYFYFNTSSISSPETMGLHCDRAVVINGVNSADINEKTCLLPVKHVEFDSFSLSYCPSEVTIRNTCPTVDVHNEIRCSCNNVTQPVTSGQTDGSDSSPSKISSGHLIKIVVSILIVCVCVCVIGFGGFFVWRHCSRKKDRSRTGDSVQQSFV